MVYLVMARNGVIFKHSLRKRYKIKLPDAIIAPTAIAYNFELITRNTTDFKNIEELSCIDAHEK